MGPFTATHLTILFQQYDSSIFCFKFPIVFQTSYLLNVENKTVYLLLHEVMTCILNFNNWHIFELPLWHVSQESI